MDAESRVLGYSDIHVSLVTISNSTIKIIVKYTNIPHGSWQGMEKSVVVKVTEMTLKSKVINDI